MPDAAATRPGSRRSPRRSAASRGRSSSSAPAASSAPTCCARFWPSARTSSARPPASPPGGSRTCPTTTSGLIDLLIDSNLDALLDEIRPRTVFDCVAYGAYSFETDSQLIYRTNFNFLTRLLPRLESRSIACFVHAGSSSEYGDNAAGPGRARPDRAQQRLRRLEGRRGQPDPLLRQAQELPCANLRLYSVYGPLEDSARLIPNVIRHGLEGTYPDVRQPGRLPRLRLRRRRDRGVRRHRAEPDRGRLRRVVQHRHRPQDDHRRGRRDGPRAVRDRRASRRSPCPTAPGTSRTGTPTSTRPGPAWAGSRGRRFRDGLQTTVDWYRGLPDKAKYHQSSKKFGLDTVYSVSAIIACYKDNQAIPIMYERLKDVFTKLNIDYEIIFVNDCSPDDSEEVIRAISRNDRRVIGITHSRNFGSQSAFRSGMEIATKNACVLLDGDLQDPPELIEQFVKPGARATTSSTAGGSSARPALFMQFAYKAFYRVFDSFSYVPIPHDAGDFSLMDRRVVKAILQFPERDLFLRGVRAFAGFKQTGVDYVRPERMFGRTTNNLLKNIGWAKKGILSFSNTPLNMLSFAGIGPAGPQRASLGSLQVVGRLLFPSSRPPGSRPCCLLILFFGSLNFFGIGVLGEYLAKIFEEVKQRPHFIRRSIIRDGEVRPATDDSPAAVSHERKAQIMTNTQSRREWAPFNRMRSRMAATSTRPTRGRAAGSPAMRHSDAIFGAADFHGKRVIDIGCGDGTYSVEIYDRGEPRASTRSTRPPRPRFAGARPVDGTSPLRPPARIRFPVRRDLRRRPPPRCPAPHGPALDALREAFRVAPASSSSSPMATISS